MYASYDNKYQLVVLIYGDTRSIHEDRLLSEAKTSFACIRFGKRI